MICACIAVLLRGHTHLFATLHRCLRRRHICLGCGALVPGCHLVCPASIGVRLVLPALYTLGGGEVSKKLAASNASQLQAAINSQHCCSPARLVSIDDAPVGVDLSDVAMCVHAFRLIWRIQPEALVAAQQQVQVVVVVVV